MLGLAEYLLHTHQLENLEFVLAVQQYLDIPVGDHAARQAVWNHRVYAGHIDVNLAKEVNIPCSVREGLERYHRSINSNTSGDEEMAALDNRVVRPALEYVTDLLRDGYSDYVQSVRRGVRPSGLPGVAPTLAGVVPHYEFATGTQRRPSALVSPLSPATVEEFAVDTEPGEGGGLGALTRHSSIESQTRPGWGGKIGRKLSKWRRSSSDA